MMRETNDRRPLILVLHGPSLSALGRREPGIYGRDTLDDIDRALRETAGRLGVDVTCTQSNHEGVLIDRILSAPDEGASGIVINPAAYTHTSLAIGDAIRASALPVVEVHLTNVAGRDHIRRHSMVAPACIGVVAGFGLASYILGLEGLVRHLTSHVQGPDL